jgi:hypothetical protein
MEREYNTKTRISQGIEIMENNMNINFQSMNQSQDPCENKKKQFDSPK